MPTNRLDFPFISVHIHNFFVILMEDSTSHLRILCSERPLALFVKVVEMQINADDESEAIAKQKWT
jgi:hypothetical protein